MNKKSSAVLQLRSKWLSFEKLFRSFERQVGHVKSNFAFWFSDGTLVKAMREGHWLLLDEINLASAETLERLAGILESPDGSVVLLERGDSVAVKRHPNFRIFGSMNPPTDFV